MEYEPVSHARVPGDDPELVWLAVACWTDPADGTREWFLELWDAQGEAGDDLPVDDEEAAKALALKRFRVPAKAWSPGPQPFSR